jgi:hypothetical protein
MGILENIIGSKEQNETAQKNLDKQAREGSKLAKFLGGNPIAEEATPGPKGFKMDMDNPKSREQQKADHERSFKMDMDSPKSRDVQKADYMRGMKKGGVVRKSASARADGCCIRGKTRA